MICFPNAKINLGLHIVEKRSDGYHNLETIFLPIGMKDALEVIPSPGLTTPFEWKNSGRQIDIAVEKNICIQALNLIRNQYPDLPPVKIHLLKHIPFGAGLGGGSSDGAFMLNLLNDCFQLSMSDTELTLLASQLGADCAFFIHNQPAFATGIGNILQPIEVPLKGYHLAIIIPDVHVSTPEAYSQIVPSKPKVPLIELIQQPVPCWKNNLTNDFEPNIFKKYPIIKEVKDYLYQQGALYASMSGSGSAVFGIFNEPPLLDRYTHFFSWTERIE